MKVLLLPFIGQSPVFIAQEEGYFEEQGLAVEIVRFDRSDDALPALIQGDLDVFSGTVKAGIFNAISRGSNIRIVAGGSYIDPNACPTNALVARRSLVEAGELDGPAQLEGRRIALNPASLKDYYLDLILAQADLTLDDVEIVQLPNPAKLDALAEGSIDLADAGEPWVTRLTETGDAVVWMHAREVIPDHQLAYLVFGPSLLEDNPEGGRRFMVAYLKGIRQYNEGKTERNLDLLEELVGMERELLEDICLEALRDSGAINAEGIVAWQEWAVGQGLLDTVVPVDQFWDSSFVDHANEVLGP